MLNIRERHVVALVHEQAIDSVSQVRVCFWEGAGNDPASLGVSMPSNAPESKLH